MLLTVQFTPNSYVLPANRPDVPLGTISGNFGGSPIEPMLVINHSDPGNIAVSSGAPHDQRRRRLQSPGVLQAAVGGQFWG
jgi:hypothetical protein